MPGNTRGVIFGMVILLVLLLFMQIALMLVPARSLRTWSYSGLLLLVGFVNMVLVWTYADDEKLSLLVNTFFLFSYAYVLGIYSRAWLRDFPMNSVNFVLAMGGMVLLIVIKFPADGFLTLPVLTGLAIVLLVPAVVKIWTIKNNCESCSSRKQYYLRLAAATASCPAIIYVLTLVAPQDNFIFAYNPVLSISQTVAVVVTGMYVFTSVVYVRKSKARKITTRVVDSGIRSLT